MKLLITTQAVDVNHPILGFFIGWILEFSKHFDEVHVICLQKGEYELPGHVHVYSLGKETGENKLKYLYRFYTSFGHIFFKVRVEYVFFHMGAIYNILAAPFFFLRRSYGTKFYWWKAHGHINMLGRIALLFCDLVFTSTESGFAINTKKRRIVGQAIDNSFFKSPQLEDRTREIIFVGRIMPVKHIEDLIATAQLLNAHDPGLAFKIIGPVGDDGYYDSLRSRIAASGLADSVTFLGPKTQSELRGIYAKALVFLNTSLTHSMDKTVLEAILCGCVPVTGNRAFRELLEKDGLYVEHADPETYAKAIKRLLAEDLTEQRKRLRTEVVKLHSLTTFSHRIFGI